MFTVLRRSEGTNPFSTATLVGRHASVSVGIPAGRFGSILVKAEGQTHEYSATASTDIVAGTTARVRGVAGAGLIVEPIAPAGDVPVQEGGTPSA
jgi:membrane protein implicated in regulation of membrane protease activity